MKPGPGNQGGQALEKFEGGHDEMGGAVSVRGFEFEDNIALRSARQAFVAQSRTGDVSAEAFEGGALMRAAVHVGMEAKALSADAALWRVVCLVAREAQGRIFPGQHFLPRSRSEGDAVRAGCRVQRVQGGVVLGISQGEAFRGVFNERAFSALADPWQENGPY
jgi:hypothetical protein